MKIQGFQRKREISLISGQRRLPGGRRRALQRVTRLCVSSGVSPRCSDTAAAGICHQLAGLGPRPGSSAEALEALQLPNSSVFQPKNSINIAHK